MFSLPLRVTSGVNKTKSTMSMPPVVIAKFEVDQAGPNKTLIENFLRAASADEQLAILKRILAIKNVDSNVLKLLAAVFFHSAAKHPVKCFLTRHVTKNMNIQKPFEEMLTAEITTHIPNSPGFQLMDRPSSCAIYYKDTVNKLAMCFENFLSGEIAVENVEKELAQYLVTCLLHCHDTLERFKSQLSPTEISEVYSLMHLVFRIMLHILNNIKLKSCSSQNNIWQGYKDFTKNIKFQCSKILEFILHDADAPMDAKSVCAIVSLTLLYLSMIDNTQDDEMYWSWVLEKLKYGEEPHVELAWCSALIATAPWSALLPTDTASDIRHTNDIMSMVRKLLDIIERSSSDGLLVLGVWRSLHRVSCVLRTGGGCGEPVLCALGAALAELVLAAVWPHLDHYLDSVRHLAAQTLAALIHYAARLETIQHTCDKYKCGGASEPLSLMLSELAALGDDRRGFYAGVRGAVAGLGGARVLAAVASLPRLLTALVRPDLTATVTAALDLLMVSCARELSAPALAERWVLPVLAWVETQSPAPPPHALAALEPLLAKAIALQPDLARHIVDYVKSACSRAPSSPRVLGVLRVARACLHTAARDDETHWCGLVAYDVLRDALEDADDETRLACLALVTGGGGAPSRGCLTLALHYLRLDLNAQDRHHHQQALALCKKFIKRVEDGHRSAKRASDEERVLMYQEWMEHLRELCFQSLRPGANCSRRRGALALLAATHPREREPLHSSWKAAWVERLLATLEDSFEANKALALDVLCHCPKELLEEVCEASGLSLEGVLKQANALKPSESASAAYKLELLWRLLPDRLLQGLTETRAEVDAAGHAACQRLVTAAFRTPCGPGWPYNDYDALHAPRDRPTYGALHCLRHLLERIDWKAISEDIHWRRLVSDVLQACDKLAYAAGGVVNTAAPEGALPAHCLVTHAGNDAGVQLEDGRQVTAQMVLLCAWRTVKEAVGVLGCVGARTPALDINGGGLVSLLVLRDVVVGRVANVVQDARHRGALEQAYLAYERVLHRWWREKVDPQAIYISMESWLQQRVEATLKWLETDSWTQPADRRSAGLPCLVLALVGTQPDPGAPRSALPRVMDALFRRAVSADVHAGDRAHVYNILRALYRHTALDTAVQSYVGGGLAVAIMGFSGATWTERNACTLLLSALLTRVFGVSRARSEISARNRMTGRVFYLRYPHLYDLMQNQLKEVSSRPEALLLCPSLYPVLLLLARLYPSSLEGTESNLKLVSFVPLVVACAASRVEHTRRLAAKAAVSLIPPDKYVGHLQYLLKLVSDERLQRNACHGLLLQIIALLENKPPGVDMVALHGSVPGTLWMLEMHARPCYPVLRQYHAVLTLLATRCGGVLGPETTASVESHLRSVLWDTSVEAAASAGRALCAAGALQMLLLLLCQRGAEGDAADQLLHAMQHREYEVVETALDCLLALHGRECSEESERLWLGNDRLLARLTRSRMLESLASALAGAGNIRLRDKMLEVAVAIGGTQDLIVTALDESWRLRDASWSRQEGQEAVDVSLLCRLLSMWRFGDFVSSISWLKRHSWSPAAVAPLLLHSALQLASEMLLTDYGSSRTELQLEEVCRAVWQGAAPERVPEECAAVAAFLERSGARLLAHPALSTRNTVSVQCYVWCAHVLLLQAEEPSTRACAERAAHRLAPVPSHTQCERALVASRTSELLLDAVERQPRAAVLLMTLALQRVSADLHPNRQRAELEVQDDEFRVFSHNERNNVFFEEELLTAACGARLRRLHAAGDGDGDVLGWLLPQLAHEDVTSALGTLCQSNYSHFLDLCNDDYARLNLTRPRLNVCKEPPHPKVELFLQEFKRQ